MHSNIESRDHDACGMCGSLTRLRCVATLRRRRRLACTSSRVRSFCRRQWTAVVGGRRQWLSGTRWRRHQLSGFGRRRRRCLFLLIFAVSDNIDRAVTRHQWWSVTDHWRSLRLVTSKLFQCAETFQLDRDDDSVSGVGACYRARLWCLTTYPSYPHSLWRRILLLLLLVMWAKVLGHWRVSGGPSRRSALVVNGPPTILKVVKHLAVFVAWECHRRRAGQYADITADDRLMLWSSVERRGRVQWPHQSASDIVESATDRRACAPHATPSKSFRRRPLLRGLNYSVICGVVTKLSDGRGLVRRNINAKHGPVIIGTIDDKNINLQIKNMKKHVFHFYKNIKNMDKKH